jgi:histone-lysine N-methyltransferase SETMAR
LGFNVLEHLAYRPDLAPSDYHFFGRLKVALQGRRYSTNKEVREAVFKWLRDQPKTFFLEGIRKPVDHWNKRIKKED